MASDVLRLSLARLFAEMTLGLVVVRAFFEGRLAGAVVLMAAVFGLGAGLAVLTDRTRRPLRAAHLMMIGAALGVASLRAELFLGQPSGLSLAPAAFLVAAAIVDLARERAMRIKDKLRASPMSVLSCLSGASMGAVLETLALARISAAVLALAVVASAITLSATFVGGPGRPVARTFDAAVFVGTGALAAAMLAR